MYENVRKGFTQSTVSLTPFFESVRLVWISTQREPTQTRQAVRYFLGTETERKEIFIIFVSTG